MWWTQACSATCYFSPLHLLTSSPLHLTKTVQTSSRARRRRLTSARDSKGRFRSWRCCSAKSWRGFSARQRASGRVTAGRRIWLRRYETDHWRCRFIAKEGNTVNKSEIINLLTQFNDYGLDAIKTENLYYFDGVAGFSLGQGQ